jgi:hypothetical protein
MRLHLQSAFDMIECFTIPTGHRSPVLDFEPFPGVHPALLSGADLDAGTQTRPVGPVARNLEKPEPPLLCVLF